MWKLFQTKCNNHKVQLWKVSNNKALPKVLLSVLQKTEYDYETDSSR